MASQVNSTITEELVAILLKLLQKIAEEGKLMNFMKSASSSELNNTITEMKNRRNQEQKNK